MRKRAIEEVLKKFDFEKAAKALRGCRWRFQGAVASPTVEELRKIAQSIVTSAVDGGWGVKCSQGPLTAENSHWGDKAVLTVTLSLNPVWASEVYVDERVIEKRRQAAADSTARKKPSQGARRRGAKAATGKATKE